MGALRAVLAVVVVLALVVAASERRERRAARRREKLRAALDRLWFDHADYAAQYISAVLSGRGDPGPLSARLHANQDQIAAAFGKYYGGPAQRELARHLHEHVALASRIVAAGKEGGRPPTSSKSGKRTPRRSRAPSAGRTPAGRVRRCPP